MEEEEGNPSSSSISGAECVDSSPLQHHLAKESLKVKLMVRRPLVALVEQGILPSPKTSPALHEQRTKLERAKMGDMLRAKIARRPQRQELVHRHILEDVVPGLDPSLCERQMQLKRARLADTLSNQLSHRPGPLELIKKNILHTEDEVVEQALKEGQIQFTPTNEGLRHLGGGGEDLLDEDSNSEGSPSQAQSPAGGTSPPQNTATATIPTPKQVFIVPKSYSQRSAPGKDQTARKKKSKPKNSGSKQRTIKFHEYKGPPTSARKSSSDKSSGGNYTPYDLLLQQQQLYLQWQLQTQQQKYQQLILPATAGTSSSPSSTSTSGALNKGSSTAQGSPRATTPIKTAVSSGSQQQQEVNDAIHMLARLDDMKVNDLKAELKKRNLTISGPKPLLIDRLKPHLEAVVVNARHLSKGLRESSPVVLQSPSSPALSGVAMEVSSSGPSSPFVMDSEASTTVINTQSVPSSPSPIPPPPPPPPPPPRPPSLAATTPKKTLLPSSPLPVSQLQLIIHQQAPQPPPLPNSAIIIESQRKQIQELQLALEKSQSQLELQRRQQHQLQNISDPTNTFNPVIKSSSLPNFNLGIPLKALENEFVLNEFNASASLNNNNNNQKNHILNQNNNNELSSFNEQGYSSSSFECDNFQLPGDDVLDLLLRSEGTPSCFESQDTDSSSEQLLSSGKSPSRGDIPPAPPLPKACSSSHSSSSFSSMCALPSNNIDFSYLDPSDLPFDVVIPEELSSAGPLDPQKCSSSSIMDVDMDVGDWLDSLLPSPGSSGVPVDNEFKSSSSSNYTSSLRELNGNIIGLNDEDIWS